MTHKQIQEVFEDRELRIDQLHYLAALSPGCPLSNGLEEFFDDEADEVFDVLKGSVPDATLKRFCDNIGEFMGDSESVTEWLHEHELYGFIAHATMPQPRFFGDDAQFEEFSWGLCYIGWFYADTLDELIEKICAWTDDRRETARQRALAKKKGEVTQDD